MGSGKPEVGGIAENHEEREEGLDNKFNAFGG